MDNESPAPICDRCYQPVTDPSAHGLNLCPLEPRRDVIWSKGFEPYFDIGLGRYVTGWGDIRKGMREEKLDFRDHPTPGDRSARRDKMEAARARKRAEGRGAHPHWNSR